MRGLVPALIAASLPVRDRSEQESHNEIKGVSAMTFYHNLSPTPANVEWCRPEMDQQGHRDGHRDDGVREKSFAHVDHLSHTPPPPLQKKMNPWQYPQSAGMFYSPVSSHYAQAYLQNSQGGFPQQRPTPQTAPSTFPSPSTFQSRPRPKGTHKCTYNQCTFSGSQKAVEIHMMDRHLIYPPDHNKHKQRDWDADPSLKGHVFPISHAILNPLSFTATSPNLFLESPSSSREPT